MATDNPQSSQEVKTELLDWWKHVLGDYATCEECDIGGACEYHKSKLDDLFCLITKRDATMKAKILAAVEANTRNEPHSDLDYVDSISLRSEINNIFESEEVA